MFQKTIILISMALLATVAIAETVSLDEVVNVNHAFQIDTKDRTLLLADVMPTSGGEEIVTVDRNNWIRIIKAGSGQLVTSVQIDLTQSTIPSPNIVVGTPCIAKLSPTDDWLSIVVPLFGNATAGSVKYGYTQLMVFWGSSAGISTDYSISQVYNLCSPFVVARDVNGDGTDELFLSGIEKLTWQSYTLGDPPVTNNVWTLRYASTAIQCNSQTRQITPYWNPQYCRYGGSFDPTNPFPVLTTTPDNLLEYMQNGPSFITSNQYPFLFPAVERVCPTISRENNTFLFTPVFTLPRFTNTSTWTNPAYDFVLAKVFLVNINAQTGSIIGAYDGNRGTTHRLATSTLNFPNGWQNAISWTSHSMKENCTIVSGMFFESESTPQNTICWTTYGHCSETEQQWVNYDYIINTTNLHPDYNSCDYSDNLNNPLHLPQDVIEYVVDPPQSIHGYSKMYRIVPGSTNYSNFLISNLWKTSPGYGLWARDLQHQTNADFVTLNPTTAQGPGLSPQTTITAYNRWDLTGTDNSNPLRPVFVGTNNTQTEWLIRTFSGVDGVAPYYPRNYYSSSGTSLPGVITDFSLSPASALTSTNTANGSVLTSVSLLPITNGTKAVGYVIHQTSPTPALDVPFAPENIITGQAYQNFRHSNNIDECWRNEVISSACNWENRVYLDNVTVDHEMSVSGGTVLEFKPGTCFYINEPITFKDFPSKSVFFNQNPANPVTIYINGNGRINGSPTFKSGFRFKIGAINPDNPLTPVISNVTIPSNPSGFTVKVNGQDLDHGGWFYRVHIDGSTRTGTGFVFEQCASSTLLEECCVDSCAIGIESYYSNIQMIADTSIKNGAFGITWTQDYPWNSERGRLHASIIADNGPINGSGPSGLYCYGCSPIITCNRFWNNNTYAVEVSGNATPMFFDDIQGLIGANRFQGIPDHPIIRIKYGDPLFTWGVNAFMLTNNAGVSSYYMTEDTQNPIFHDLAVNWFDRPENEILALLNPSNPGIWNFSPVANDSLGCGAQLGAGLGDFMLLVAGDRKLAQQQLDSAAYYYTLAYTRSGDTTSVGAVALSRLSKLSPELPAVGSTMLKKALYDESYAFDAAGSFSTADAKRDTILVNATQHDSLRIEFDLAVSEMLRAQTMSVGPRAELAQEAARVNRENKLYKMIGFTPEIEQAIVSKEIPTSYRLYPMYPNPFNATTNIKFDVPSASHVKVQVFDALGRLVVTLADQQFSAGIHQTKWNGRNASGASASSGIYFVTLNSNQMHLAGKIVLLR